jgi:hypothetical protein
MAEQLTKAEIYLTKSSKVLLPSGNAYPGEGIVATAAKNLQALGFGLSAPLLERLSSLPKQQVVDWYQSALPLLEKMVGAHRMFKPMYPNFPKQVMQASDAELFFNAMTHYYGFMLSDLLGDPNLVVLPQYEKEVRPELTEFQELRWLDLGSEEDFNQIFTKLASSGSSLSPFDKEILRWFATNRDVESLLAERIPQKETLAFLVSVMPNPACLLPLVKTATDVLRVAVAMSEGDLSLAEATKFRNFRKVERRFLLGCLEAVGSSLIEDMLRWKERWVRLGERLHPGDFKKRYPKSLEAFDVLRNQTPFRTFNSLAEEAISQGDADATANLLQKRPGDFVRRLDHVLRSHASTSRIIESVIGSSSKVSTPVLLQAWHHFHSREHVRSRAFFPKGNAAKVQYQEGELPRLPDGVAVRVASELRQVLVDRFAERPSLGNVFIDERLKSQLVPFAARSASRSLRCITRGSSFDLPAGETVRFFCWWKNIALEDSEQSRVDLDLSASLFESDWTSSGQIAYYNLREGQCYHSGDITSAPQGACEFIDVNLNSILEMGARFVVMSVSSFTSQPFLSLPECFGGWMMRAKPNSGEVFEPKTVHDKIDITAASRTCVPVIIDAQSRRLYWSDLALKSAGQINNAAKNSVGFSQIGRSIVELRKPTLYDLFNMHAEARGTVVNDPKRADTVFDLYDGTINAFDTMAISSEFLS